MFGKAMPGRKWCSIVSEKEEESSFEIEQQTKEKLVPNHSTITKEKTNVPVISQQKDVSSSNKATTKVVVQKSTTNTPKTPRTKFSFGFRTISPQQLVVEKKLTVQSKPSQSKPTPFKPSPPKSIIPDEDEHCKLNITPVKSIITKDIEEEEIEDSSIIEDSFIEEEKEDKSSNIVSVKTFPSLTTIDISSSDDRNIVNNSNNSMSLTQKNITNFFGGSASTSRKPTSKVDIKVVEKEKSVKISGKENKRKRKRKAKSMGFDEPPKKKQKKSFKPLDVLELSENEEEIINLESSQEILGCSSDSLNTSSLVIKKSEKVVNLTELLSGNRKLTKTLPEHIVKSLRQFQVGDDEITLDFELLSSEIFSVKQIGKKRRKRNTIASTSKLKVSASQKLHSILQSIPRSKFDTELKKQVLPLIYHDELCKLLRGSGVTVCPIPKRVLNIFLEAQKNKKKNTSSVVDLSGISPKLMDSLYAFQLRGVVFALRKNGRCLLGDEMGLGKTVQAISVAACYRDEWPLLVICPSSMRSAWANEFIKWLDLCPLDIREIMKAKESIDSLVSIISYDLVHKMIPKIEKTNFQVVIADESHMIKNNVAKRTNAIVPILKNSKRVILLSGTPALSRPEEVFTQLDALRPDIFPSKKGFELFATRYCNGHKGAWGWDTKGASHLTELHTLLCETAMIRRKKLDVLHELPSKHRHTISIDADVLQPLVDGLGELKRLEQTIHKYQNSDRARNAKREKQVLTSMLYVETARSKLPAVQRYLMSVLQTQPNEKFIVFAHHQHMLDGIVDILNRLEVSFIRIDGSTSAKFRQGLVDQFQQREDYRIALLSITAGGTGLTLNEASSVIFAELYWTPALLQQAEDRAHRIGQKNDVNVFYLLGKGTLDDAIWPLVSKKLDIVGKTIDGEKDQVMGATPMEVDIPLDFDLPIPDNLLTGDNSKYSSIEEIEEIEEIESFL